MITIIELIEQLEELKLKSYIIWINITDNSYHIRYQEKDSGHIRYWNGIYYWNDITEEDIKKINRFIYGYTK